MYAEVYTDGSVYPNPGPGGWGAIVLTRKVAVLLHGRCDERTTNNRMELTGILRGLDVLPDECSVDLHTDSQWCIGALFKGWNITKNLDLIAEIRPHLKRLTVRPNFVRGHSGHVWNELADRLAGSGIYAIPQDTEPIHKRDWIALTFSESYDTKPFVRGPKHRVVNGPVQLDLSDVDDAL